ncbi:MAG: DivIVA domain-containing protein [Gemmatimonadetes bacterium]|nr:DivIVA domain-containing protein [Gemmatimonadota bacterium]
MTEDGFNLSAHDVRHQEFHKALRGYDPTQVDDFKERIAQELDRLWRDRGQLNDRLQHMVEQLKVFRDRERAMNDALIAAQQLRADVQTQADKEAELILQRARAQADQLVAEARMTAQQVLADANGQGQRLYHANDSVRRQFASYLASYRRMLERELAELDALVSMEEHPTPESLPGAPAARRPA